MINIVQLANKFETALNALRLADEDWEFKIWANAGEFEKPQRQGNTVNYPINAQLSTVSTALEANVLIMGVNGLELEVLVPTYPPRTNTSQTDSELQKIQDGQIVFPLRIAQILDQYFSQTQTFNLTDDNGDVYACSMVGGVSIADLIDIESGIAESIPLSVSITITFLLGGINSLDVKLYMDGERIPFLSCNPSRSDTLSTDLQSNAVAQKSIATSSAYGIQFTSPSSVANAATAAVYSMIADEDEINTAHFIELEWGSQRDDVYLMFVSSANVTASSADFAGLNTTLAEAYGNDEYFHFPDGFSIGAFTSSVSSATSVTFTIDAEFIKEFSAGAEIPQTYPFYYYIAGKAYKLDAALISSGNVAASYAVTATVTAELESDDYSYSEENGNYVIHLVTSAVVTVTDVSTGFTFNGGD